MKNKILYFIRNIIERITNKHCGRCKHCLEGVTCDSYTRYFECQSGIYPTEFEPQEDTK